MAVCSKPDSFVKQIALYLQNEEHQKARDLSAEMAAAFPDEMISHFLLAKSSFRLTRYGDAVEEGTRAFNLARSRPDMEACAILISAARFMLGQYPEGYRLLLMFEPDNTEQVEELLLIFSSVLGDERATEKHVRTLMRIDNEAAEELLRKFGAA